MWQRIDCSLTIPRLQRVNPSMVQNDKITMWQPIDCLKRLQRVKTAQLQCGNESDNQLIVLVVPITHETHLRGRRRGAVASDVPVAVDSAIPPVVFGTKESDEMC